MDESSIAVMADPQAGLARVVKPISGFEALYQGEQAQDDPLALSRPIGFYEWKNGRPPSQLDPTVGKPGIDPLLLEFLPVSMGSQLLLGIPLIGNPGGAAIAYRYRVIWRWTSLGRLQQQLDSQYHIPQESAGAPDTSAGPPGLLRFVLPAALETALITPVSPTAPPFLTDTVTLVRSSIVQNELHLPGLPIVSQPGAIGGHYQQGIVDPAVFPGNYPFSPVFAIVPIKAKGDRMLIVADRPDLPTTSEGWQFATGQTDEGFSRLYGNGSLTASPHPPFPTVGIYVFQVTSPCCTSAFAEGLVDIGPSG